ncbi:MAG: chorismate-binding protein [Marmoricola sp.]
MTAPIPRLVARTIEIDDPGPLLDLLTEESPMTWIRRGEGFVTMGIAATFTSQGKSRFDDASSWWHEVVRVAAVADEVGVPGSGLIALGSFAFADSPGDSAMVVPSVVVGRRGDRCWLTTIGETSSTPPTLEPQAAPPAPTDLSYADGALSGADWEGVVWEAVLQLNAGELDKVVLARDLIATAAEPIDVRWPLRRLGSTYDMCWTFHVDGLFGATPELLVRREKGLVTSRVLAGTIRRTGDDEHDLQLAATLARSSKDLEEHEYAVRSVADALAPYCSSMNVPEAPFVLHLPNVMHLATDVAGVALDGGASVLDLAAALHPSAAVGGTPTKVALELIAEIEGMDRGRYAGPVGWVNAHGDGEFGIALRSGQLDGSQVRLFAGCGIVAGSDPEAELAESQAKFVPVRDALGS